MAWLDKRGQTFRVVFQIGGRTFKRSLETTNQREVLGRLSALEQRIKLVEHGELIVPEDVDLHEFLLQNGKPKPVLAVVPSLKLSSAIADYLDSIPAQSLEENSLCTLRIHLRHVERILGSAFRIEKLTFNDLQRYVDDRSHEKNPRGRHINAVTIRKELTSCSGLWSWLCRSGKCRGEFPNRGLRYHEPYREAIRRIQDGAVGEIRTMLANDYRTTIWHHARQPKWTDMHWQMRNWYYFTWLSGDFNVEQHVHNLDVCVWALGEQYPVKAIGIGGREVRKGPEYGNIFDHHSVVYEYANGARLISNTRQMDGCQNDISIHMLGSNGTAHLTERRNGVRIAAADEWVYRGDPKNLYQVEHDELFASIRSGQPINNGEYMAKSTLLAIMGRMATYTGKEITWDMAWNSKEDLTPAKYEWGKIAAPQVAVPGFTEFL